jgi:hypothetical protein
MFDTVCELKLLGVFGLSPSSGIHKKPTAQRFKKWIYCHPQMEEAPTLFGLLERVSLNFCIT